MATKDYSKMTTKKLEALLETASAEDKAAIEEVLAKRASISSTEAPEKEETETAKTAEKPAKTGLKFTDEERIAIATELREKHMNHRCEVVPFNTADWVNGTIRGIIEEKRTNKVLYAVQVDDGRRIVKSIDSKLIRILDEVVEPEKKTRKPRTKEVRLDENGNPIIEAKEEVIWTEEEVKAAVDSVIDNVGKVISYPEASKGGLVEKDAPTVYGRIVSIVPNKRNRTILYRVLIDGTTDKFAHKAVNNEALVIAEDFDEEGQKINEAFINRRNREPKQKVVKTVQEQYDLLKASLANAEERMVKWTETVEQRKQKLEAFLKENEAKINGTAENVENSTAENVENSTAENVENSTAENIENEPSESMDELA